MKERYIDLMERVLSAYTENHIERYTSEVLERGLWEHGYPRLTANIGILLAHGRRAELKDTFKNMMDICCAQIPVAKEKAPRCGNDFSVKEIVFCILELEKADIFPAEVTSGWRNALTKINPYTTYYMLAEYPPQELNNWAVFGAASEQVRKFAGIGDASAFIDKQIQSQLHCFDEKGMYRDPHEPMVYDMVTRLQLAAALYFGYDGEGRAELESFLLKSADITLQMQSVTGEIPFGGRSNQFLHNETFLAALFEFYAAWLKKRGDGEKAKKCKRAAKIAAEHIIPWLENETITHIKNFYAADSGYGCEKYAYFDKYMITTASWLYLAYIMADDTIQEECCPAEAGGYICKTSAHFHKIFCNTGTYFLEIDTAADLHYDASGIGRIHRKGAPSAICLSMPFSPCPSYKLDIENPSPLSICCGIKNADGTASYTYDEKTKYTVTEESVQGNSVSVGLCCTLENGAVIAEKCTVSENGVRIEAEGEGELSVLLPAFVFDGKNHTQICTGEDSISVIYKGWECRYKADTVIIDTAAEYGNRNGHYKCFAVKGQNRVTVDIQIHKRVEE